MKNSEYWLKRAQQLEGAQTKKNIEYFGGELERIYQKAIRDIEKDIARWYTRFAKNNSITIAEAKKLLNSRELEEFKWTVEEYIDYGRKNAVSGEWMERLENASARYHISRLEALKLQMQNHVEVLMGNEADDVTDLMREHLEDGYYRTAFEIQKFVGIGTSFSQLDEDTIEKVLSKPWTSDGMNFSERIWGAHRTELVNDLHKKLTQSIIMGENPKVLAKGFAKYVSDEAAKSIRAKKSRAENLIMTETSYFRSEGQRRCYKELGVEEFENCATLDSRTSETCRDMDGTHFPVSDMQPGLNSPPFHNRCRTATCPYFDDEFTADEVRAARAGDGSYYTVPANMTYREWRNNLTAGQRQELDFQTKAARNRSADKKQHEWYKKVLGTKNVPKSLDEFQRLKYNDGDSEMWNFIKLDYERQNRLIHNPELALPNAKNATADDRKFTEYLFNPLNQKGYSKGKAFISRLGYDDKNFAELKNAILESAQKYPSTYKNTDKFGDKYEQKIILYGKNKKPANVVIGWKVNKNQTWMTSAYIKEVDK